MHGWNHHVCMNLNSSFRSLLGNSTPSTLHVEWIDTEPQVNVENSHDERANIREHSNDPNDYENAVDNQIPDHRTCISLKN